eukprot:TRINITY_DN50_c0_g1_i3.p1 TRINITY_DN50_c0_g1~~TRINITY_DN50_c0_g1_i3.p1  ORF type:complete len:161 (-),score=27.20 TRINITY_DN50_c0_g1_i3:138-620(-)
MHYPQPGLQCNCGIGLHYSYGKNYSGGVYSCDRCHNNYPCSSQHYNCPNCEMDICNYCMSGPGPSPVPYDPSPVPDPYHPDPPMPGPVRPIYRPMPGPVPGPYSGSCPVCHAYSLTPDQGDYYNPVFKCADCKGTFNFNSVEAYRCQSCNSYICNGCYNS